MSRRGRAARGGASRAVAAVMLASCAAHDPALEIDHRGPANLAVIYRVEEDGTLGWGGGQSAREGRITWTGAMSGAELEGLRAILSEDGWLDSGPASTEGADSEWRTKVELDAPGGRRRYRVTGRSPEVERLVRHLDLIARRRNDEALEILPKPRPGDL
jgi:hypothetical protein